MYLHSSMSKDTPEIIRKICSKGSAAVLGFQTRPVLPVRIDCVIEGSAEQRPFTTKGVGGVGRWRGGGILEKSIHSIQITFLFTVSTVAKHQKVQRKA